jgi:SAM-dependent methyltransferase
MVSLRITPHCTGALCYHLTMSDVPWCGLYEKRREVNARYGSVFRLPTVRRAARLAESYLAPGIRILEVGPGTNPRGKRLAARVADATAVGVDPDGGDFRSLDEVEGTFGLALLLEVIEHLSLAESIDLLRGIHDRLEPGGALIVSTPNVFCPGRFLRDATHVTPFAYDELGGVLLLAGFEVESLFRVVPGHLFRRIGKTLISPLGRALGIDHAPSIAAVALRGN